MAVHCILPVHEPHKTAIPDSPGRGILATDKVKGFKLTKSKQSLSSFLFVEDAIIQLCQKQCSIDFCGLTANATATSINNLATAFTNCPSGILITLGLKSVVVQVKED